MQAVQQAPQLRTRRLDAGLGPQAPDPAVASHQAEGIVVASGPPSGTRAWRPDLGASREVEARRCDTDDAVNCALQHDLRPEHGRPGTEVAIAEGGAHYGHRFVRSILLDAECATRQRNDVEDAEESG